MLHLILFDCPRMSSTYDVAYCCRTDRNEIEIVILMSGVMRNHTNSVLLCSQYHTPMSVYKAIPRGLETLSVVGELHSPTSDSVTPVLPNLCTSEGAGSHLGCLVIDTQRHASMIGYPVVRFCKTNLQQPVQVLPYLIDLQCCFCLWTVTLPMCQTDRLK